jgi:serine phosphatase RsbU (regulator of sigma subunit)
MRKRARPLLLAATLIGLPLPNVNLSLPPVSLPVPGVEVTVPSTKVTLPSVNLSAPAVSVSTPSVSVSTPSVSTAAAGSKETGSTQPEAPSGGGGGKSGGGGGESPSGQAGEGTSGQPHSSGGGGSSAGSSPTYARQQGASGAVATAATSSTRPSSTLGSSATTAASHHSRAGVHGRTSSRAGRRPAVATVPAESLARGVSVATVTRTVAPAAVSRRRGHASPLSRIGKEIPLPLPVPDWSKPIILLLAALALWFGMRSRMESRRARRLERQHATLLEDVDAMQAALVPEIPARVGGLAVSVAYRPADGPAAGGDFYDVFVPERGQVAIILGDVAGHGHGALEQAALTRYTLRAYLQAGMEPRAALALTGRVLARPSAEQFATVIVGMYSAREGLLTFASAGHPPPILHGLETREPLKACASPPVGWTVPTGRRQTCVSLPPGAVVCFFSDGLIEARNRLGLLGRGRLSEMLGELGARPSATKLLALVRAASVATPDDMAACILVSEVAPIGPTVHLEELEVDEATFESDQARRFLETCQVPAGALERALYQAGDMLATRGTALIRVKLAAGVGSAEVSPGSLPPASADARRSQPVGTR